MKTIKELEKEIEEERIKLKSVDIKKLNTKEVIKLNDYIEIIMKEREIVVLKDVLKLIDDWLKENTKGLKKDFDKTTLIFSYWDISEDLKKEIQGK